MSKLEARCAELVGERDELATELQELDAQHERALAKVIEKREELHSSNVALTTQVEVLKRRLGELESGGGAAASITGPVPPTSLPGGGEREHHQAETQTDGDSSVDETEKVAAAAAAAAKQKSAEMRHAQLEADVAKAEQRLCDAQAELEAIVAEQRQQQQHLQDLLVQQQNVTAELAKEKAAALVVGAGDGGGNAVGGELDSTRTEPEGATVEESYTSHPKVGPVGCFVDDNYSHRFNEQLKVELELVRQKLDRTEKLRVQNEEEIVGLKETTLAVQSELAAVAVSNLAE